MTLRRKRWLGAAAIASVLLVLVLVLVRVSSDDAVSSAESKIVSDNDVSVDAVVTRDEGTSVTSVASGLSRPPSNEVNAESCGKTEIPARDEVEHERQLWKYNFLADQLARSRDAEYLLGASLLTTKSGPAVAEERLIQAAEIAPNHPIIAWHHIRLCREQSSLQCDFAAVESRALEVDGNNGALLLELAISKLKNSNDEAAEELVRRAIAAPKFDNYFIDYAMIIERALATGEDQGYVERIVAGIGYSAALGMDYGEVTRHCRDLPDPADPWVGLCWRLGQKMFTSSESLLDRSIGTSISKIAARHEPSSARAYEALRNEKEFKRYYGELMKDRSMWAVAETDERVMRQYVENFSTYGELGAIERLKTEVDRLKTLADYDPCNFVPTPIPALDELDLKTLDNVP